MASCSCSEALDVAEQHLTAQQLWVADLTASRNLWQVPVPLARRASISFGRNGQLLVCGPNGIWEASVEQKTAQQLHLPAAGASGLSAGVQSAVLLVLLPRMLFDCHGSAWGLAAVVFVGGSAICQELPLHSLQLYCAQAHLMAGTRSPKQAPSFGPPCASQQRGMQ